MALTMYAENDSGHRRDLRALEQYLRGLTTVTTDSRHFGKSIERARGIFAMKSKLIESGQK